MSLLSGVVFDWDGTLMDTERCITAAHREMFAVRGYAMTTADRAALAGRSSSAMAAVLAHRFGHEHRADLEAELISRISRELTEHARPMPGAAELVATLAQEMPIAVASNTTRTLMTASMGRSGMTGLFTAVVTADDVTAGKPDPQIYQLACQLLSLEPAAVLAVEDTEVGVTAARAAGLQVACAPSTPGAGGQADLILDGLTDPRLIAAIRQGRHGPAYATPTSPRADR